MKVKEDTIKTYDPKQIVVTFGGRQITGFADGTFVTVRRNADAWSLQMGTDGEGTRSKSNDNSGQVEISLMQSSLSNDFLSSIAISDQVANAGLLPLLVKDVNGNFLATAEQAFIKKLPDSEYGREATNRSYIIETDNLVLFLGGVA